MLGMQHSEVSSGGKGKAHVVTACLRRIDISVASQGCRDRATEIVACQLGQNTDRDQDSMAPRLVTSNADAKKTATRYQ